MAQTTETDAAVHWIGSAPTSLHGNGAGSFDRSSHDWREVTCRLCLMLQGHRSDVEGQR